MSTLRKVTGDFLTDGVLHLPLVDRVSADRRALGPQPKIGGHGFSSAARDDATGSEGGNLCLTGSGSFLLSNQVAQLDVQHVSACLGLHLLRRCRE